MTTYDLGDGVNLDHLVYDRDDALAAATVVLTVTKPSGATILPTISTPSIGHYRAATFTPDAVGAWAYEWVVSGAVVDVTAGTFVVADPGPQPYCTLPQLKDWLKLDADDTQDDDLLAGALSSVSTEIDDVCGRRFDRDETVSARVFQPVSTCLCFTDDFWTLSGLIIVVDGTTWTATDYQLYPLNGLINGRPWPYTRIEALTTAMTTGSATVQVTARWGWATVPAPVVEACKIAASETFALKDARFGVAGFGANGDIRVRDNPMVLKKLKPYMRNPQKVA